MLNFFKPINTGSAKQSAAKRHVPQASLHAQKKPKCSQATVGLVNGNRQALNVGVEPIQLDVEGPPLLTGARQAEPHIRLQGSNQHCTPAVENSSISAAAGISNAEDNLSKGGVPHNMQEEQIQRTDSSGSNPATSHVRRFKGVPYAPDAGSIHFLTNMGFSQDQAVRALKVTQGNIERAANWLLSGM